MAPHFDWSRCVFLYGLAEPLLSERPLWQYPAAPKRQYRNQSFGIRPPNQHQRSSLDLRYEVLGLGLQTAGSPQQSRPSSAQQALLSYLRRWPHNKCCGRCGVRLPPRTGARLSIHSLSFTDLHTYLLCTTRRRVPSLERREERRSDYWQGTCNFSVHIIWLVRPFYSFNDTSFPRKSFKRLLLVQPSFLLS